MFFKKLSTKDLNTVKGPARKFLVTDETGKMYDSWMDKWNENWREGDEVKIDPAQITSRLYNGKEYFTINRPASSKTVVAAAVNNEKLDKIYQLLSEVNTKVDRLVLASKSVVTLEEVEATLPPDDMPEWMKEIH